MGSEVLEEHVAALNARDIERVLDGLASDVEWVAPGGVFLHGAAQVEAFLLAWWHAFPDTSHELRAQVVSEALSALEAVLTGTHSRTLRTTWGDIPPTDRAVRLPYAGIIRFKDGRIASKHVYFDLVQLLTQLGVRREFVVTHSVDRSRRERAADPLATECPSKGGETWAPDVPR